MPGKVRRERAAGILDMARASLSGLLHNEYNR